jgi:hypothetical protein
MWPNSPELAALRTEIIINLEEKRSVEQEERAGARAALAGDRRSAAISSLPGERQPVDAAEAIALSEAAFSAGRYFDSHWLATLGERLAIQGSPEAASAARLAGRAWNQIESQAPNSREVRLYSLFNLKRSGYQAMNSGDWIRAFYIFQELAALTPDDPDAANFLAASERGTKEVAFFIEEMALSLGEILTGAMFSLPGLTEGSRVVLRFASLSSSQDDAYGMGIDYMSFDARSRPVVSLQAPYAKLLPFNMDGKSQVLILMRALDRNDQNRRWEPTWDIGGEASAQIILDIDFDDFLLLAHIRHGLPNMEVAELFTAAKLSGAAGYVPQVFEAEILNRFGAVLLFLPLAICAIITGWRFRAQSKPRYFFILLLPILPIIFHAMTFVSRSILNTLGIWLVLALGFSTALIVFIAAMALYFFLSLIVLAAQHG